MQTLKTVPHPLIHSAFLYSRSFSLHVFSCFRQPTTTTINHTPRQCTGIRDRSKSVELWTGVAQYCLLVGNYNSATVILDSLQSPAIARLHATVSYYFCECIRRAPCRYTPEAPCLVCPGCKMKRRTCSLCVFHVLVALYMSCCHVSTTPKTRPETVTLHGLDKQNHQIIWLAIVSYLFALSVSLHAMSE